MPVPRPKLVEVRSPLTRGTAEALRRSVERYSGDLAGRLLDDTLEEIHGALLSILNPQQVVREGAAQTVTEGYNPASARQAIGELLDELGADGFKSRIDFAVKTSTEVARGAGRFLEAQAEVEEYPAWELVRMYDRKEPRLWKGDEGTEDASLGAGFKSRWYQAAQIGGDAAAARVLQDSGRMVALKSSGIWQALGDSFDDSLGNPFPPFAFNSGMEVEGVPRNECEELGLLDPGEFAAAHPLDVDNLFAPIPAKEAA